MTLTKFDPKSILGGPKNPNFDSAIRMGWNQCHCEDYQILIPTTIHGSKSALERSRCHENRHNAPIDAPLTSESHNFWSDRWIFKIHTFSETGSQDLSRHVKINLIRGGLRLAALQGPPLRNLCRGYKKPRHPSDRRMIIFFFLGFALCLVFLHISPLSQTQKTPKKTHQSFFILLSSPKIQGIVFIPNLLFLGSTLWIWGLGVWI